MPARPDIPDRQLRQTLRVASVKGDRVLLEGRRPSACSACAARSGCGAGALAEMAGSAPLRLSLGGAGSLCAGDEVEVSIPAGTFLSAAALAWLVPPAALVMAAALCDLADVSDGLAAAICLPVLALSFLPLRFADRRGRMLSRLRIEEPGQ